MQVKCATDYYPEVTTTTRSPNFEVNPMIFINPKTDFAFKKIFGSEKIMLQARYS
jgi:hypothetical protein